VEDRIATARHFLFVPGNRPERFDKAVNSGVDIVVIDLEDAVPPDQKAEARSQTLRWLDAGGRAMVRINSSDSPYFSDDCTIVEHPNLLGVMLPKSAPGQILDKLACRAPVLALVETATGIAALAEIAGTPGVVRMALGTIDLALDLDLEGDDRLFDSIRLQMTVASRAANIAAPVDGVTAAFANDDATRSAMGSSRRLGFTAKLCIHPRQLDAVESALQPTDAQLQRARRIVEADKDSGGAAVALDGAMIDRPIVERAHRLLSAAAR